MNDAINNMIAELKQHAETAVRTEYEKTVEMLKGRVATLERELASLENDLAEVSNDNEDLSSRLYALQYQLRAALDASA